MHSTDKVRRSTGEEGGTEGGDEYKVEWGREDSNYMNTSGPKVIFLSLRFTILVIPDWNIRKLRI